MTALIPVGKRKPSRVAVQPIISAPRAGPDTPTTPEKLMTRAR